MKFLSYVRQILGALNTLLFKVVFFLSPAIVLFIALFYLWKVVTDLTKDTTQITNGAFAISGSLSALSFAFARSLDSEESIKDHIRFAGERLFHAALFFILGSVVKYGVIEFVGFEDAMWRRIIRGIGGSLVSLLFAQAIFVGHTGIKILNRHLTYRMTRKPDWNDIV